MFYARNSAGKRRTPDIEFNYGRWYALGSTAIQR